jgi:hypothetical protein
MITWSPIPIFRTGPFVNRVPGLFQGEHDLSEVMRFVADQVAGKSCCKW